jgi:hypothetical protein
VASGDRVVILLPSDLVPVADLIVNVCEYRGVPHIRAYPFATGITDWDRLIGAFRSFRPTVVFVAPGVAVQFTRLVKQRGHLAELRESVRSLMLLGEVSTGPMRARIGTWWDARCYDISYGSTETGTLAASCVDGSLHMLTAANYFELSTESGIEPVHGGVGLRLGSESIRPEPDGAGRAARRTADPPPRARQPGAALGRAERAVLGQRGRRVVLRHDQDRTARPAGVAYESHGTRPSSSKSRAGTTPADGIPASATSAQPPTRPSTTPLPGSR